ncbi:hypothetical protein HOC35_01060 [Candidatus Woesearchaeota archaeon]|nr:hypothetical protein [Candidatus Woesearchaeota archaeon]
MNSKINKYSILIFTLISLIVLILFSFNALALNPGCPPDCSIADVPDLIFTDPDLAYSFDPEYTITTLGDEFLKTRPQIAYSYFKANPNKMLFYPEGAKNYFLETKNPDRVLMKKYLRGFMLPLSISGDNHKVARKYLNDVNFNDLNDREILASHLLTLHPLTSKDRAITKKYLIKNNGKYINNDIQGKIIFSKYLRAEGVDVNAISGNIISFSSDGKLKCKGSTINVYDLKKGSAKDKYAMEVTSNGKLKLILKYKKEKEIEVFKTAKEKEVAKKALAGLGKGWNDFVGAYGDNEIVQALTIEEETLESVGDEFAESKKIVEEDLRKAIPLEGDIKINGDNGRISIKKGKIREINVRDARDIEVGPSSFTGRIGEVEGIEFEREKVDIAGKKVRVPPIITVHDKYATAYNIQSGGATRVHRVAPIIEGHGAKIKKVKATTIGGYEYYTTDNKGITKVKSYGPDPYRGRKGIYLEGEFIVDDYDDVSSSRRLYLYSGKSDEKTLSVNGVEITPHNKFATRLFFPNQEKIMKKPLYSTSEYVGFTKDGIITHGKNVKTSMSPGAYVQHEKALGRNVKDFMDFPSRGYFSPGDKASKGSRKYNDILNIQKVVGSKQTGVYDKQTSAKVKDWQETQVLDGNKIGVDGFFGQESLNAILSSSQGRIVVEGKSTDAEVKIKFEKGEIISDIFGDTNVRKGRELYKHTSIKFAEASNGKQEAPLELIKKSFEDKPKGDTGPTSKLEKVVAVDPDKEKEVTFPITFRQDKSIYPSERVSESEYNLYRRYFDFPSRKALISGEDSVEKLIGPTISPSTDLDFVDAFVNPDLIKEQGGYIELHPDFENMVDDGKIRILYAPGASREKQSGGRIVPMTYDSNGVLADDRKIKRSSPKKYKTKDGSDVEVEMTVVYTAQDAANEFAKGGYDVFHTSSHTYGGRYSGFSFSTDEEGIKRGVFRPWNYPAIKKLNNDQKPALVSISGCMSERRTGSKLRGLGRGVNTITTERSISGDSATIVLNGLLTGRSGKEIAYISDIEEGTRKGAYVYKKDGS